MDYSHLEEVGIQRNVDEAPGGSRPLEVSRAAPRGCRSLLVDDNVVDSHVYLTSLETLK
jgi:hypothetical protein